MKDGKAESPTSAEAAPAGKPETRPAWAVYPTHAGEPAEGGVLGRAGPKVDGRARITGAAAYTDEQFAHFLQTGEKPDGSHARPPMPQFRMNEEDARAVVAYIKTVPRAS